MPAYTPHHLPNRQYGPQKTCPTCGETLLARLTFCPNCGQDMRAIPENARSVTDGRTQFQIPAYLRMEPEGRWFDEQSAGTGIVWLGLALLAVPVVTRNLSPISLGAWLVGLLLAGAGIVRARRDSQALLRAGMLAAAAGLLTLLLLAEHIYRGKPSSSQSISNRATAQLTPTAENTDDDDKLAINPSGTNPMYRGGPAHRGVLAGPVLEGNPYRAWRFDTGGDLRSTPAISGTTAFLGTRNGYLIALDLLTQQQKWSFDLGGYPVRSSPAIEDGVVYIASGFNIFAVDADTGRQRWKLAIDYAGESSPIIADGTVYVASKKNHLYAIDAESGKQLWFYKTNGLLFGSPSVSGDTVVIGGDDGDLFAIDRSHGRLVWKIELGSGIYSTPAIDDERVFVTTRERTTFAVELSTGKEIWRYPVGGSASPAVADGVVYIGSDDGAIYAIDAAKGGNPLWLFASGNTAAQAPIVAGDELFFSAGATITSLDRETGKVVWTYPVGDEVTTELVVLDGYLFAGDRHGYFYVISGDAALATPGNED